MRHVAFLVLITGFLLICGCANSQDSAGLIKEETKPTAEASSLQEDSAFVKEADKTVPKEKTPEEEPPAPADNVYEIKEKMFIAQCNDVYLNPDDYKDRTIKLQGMYDEYTDPETKQNYRYVIRLGPGCCQNDSVAGFVILYDLR